MSSLCAISLAILLGLVICPLPTDALSTRAMDASGLPSDVKYIRCETCAAVAKSAAASVNDLDATDLKQLKVLDLVESLCKPAGEPGRWMRTTDLVERLGKLRLIPKDGQQDCKRECKTMALACTDVLDGVETELSERLYLWRREQKEIDEKELENWLCAKRTGTSDACRYAPPMLPRDRAPGPSFSPKDKKDIDMENMMEEIRAANGGNDFNMNMFSRDQMPGMGGADEDDDDDDDDDDDERDGDGEGDDESHLKDGEDGIVQDDERNEADATRKSDDASFADTELGEADSGALGGIEDPSTIGSRGATDGSLADSASDEL